MKNTRHFPNPAQAATNRGCYNSALLAAKRLRIIMPDFVLRSALLLFALLIAACAQRPPVPSDALPASVRSAPALPEEALRQISAAPANERAELTLLWTADYIAVGRLDAADKLLITLDGQPLAPSQIVRRGLLRAQLHLAAQDADSAVEVLNDRRLLAALADSPVNLQSRIGLLRADALTLRGDLLPSLQERVTVDHLLDGEARKYNRSMIWTQLMMVPSLELLDAERRTDDSTLAGWLELARLYRDPLSDIDTQLRNLDDWQRRQPRHPAASDTPDMIQALRLAVRDRPTSIAILLPESGPLAAPADAIRDGLLASYYSAQTQGHPVPELHFIDSANGDIIALYNQALTHNPGLIIGPLDREQVTVLAAIADLPVTTLALNYIDGQSAGGRLYQFGLAPEDEARQVAEQAITEGLTLAAVMYPRDSSGWGLRVATAFIDRFQSLGGTVTTSSAYANDASADTRAMLAIGQSENRARQLRRHSSLAIEFEPRRRQDIDVVFLVGSPAQARQLKPALNFHYASNLPVFATSHIYSGAVTPDRDNDLNGVRFVDIPWLLESGSPLHTQTAEVWPDGHGRYERLFAMGIDAYRLHARLLMLDTVPDSFLPGVTGQLSVSDNRVLTRRLTWAWFRQGRAQRIPVVAGSHQGADHGRSATIVAPPTR